MKRSVFFVSDGTGITAETLGHSLLTQFDNIEFEEITVPYVNNVEKANNLLTKLEKVYQQDGQRPLIFSTLVNPDILKIIESSSALIIDFFKAFISPLEQELKTKSSHTIGKSHGLLNYKNYMQRIDSVNYTLANDDGANIHDYTKADIILLGVSRCGKTPTSLYLALKFGLYAANYPFTMDDMQEIKIPKFLQPHRKKLFGLSIEPHRLMQIRQERRADSAYASSKQCYNEVHQVEFLFKREKIPFLNTTTRSIEEIAAEILLITGLKKRIY